MKILYHLILAAILTCLLNVAIGQEVNWKALRPSQKHIVNLNVGLDNSFNAGVGYGYHISTKMPILLNVEYSMPLGENVFDDLKTKIGGQVNVVRLNNFYATAKIYGVIRRFENDMARMINFGSVLSATAGIYKDKWYAAGEFGFDKAVTTHIRHSYIAKENNPELESGWYIPSGGNFIYGLQGGYSFKSNEVYAKVGRTVNQDLKTKSTLPYYVQVGWNVKLGL